MAVAVVVASLVAPFAARASIQVVPPTGNVDLAVMDELQVALETVAADTAPEVDGVLWLSAEPSGADVAIVVELATSDGKEVIRESRLASRASAAAQVRAMAREAIRELERPMTPAAPPTPASPQPETAPEKTAVSVQLAKPEPKERVYPELNLPYARGKTVWPSVVVTMAGAAIGGAMQIGGGASGLEGSSSRGIMVAGGVLGGIAVALGPSIGHFRVSNNLQGSLGLIGRALLIDGAVTFLALVAGDFHGVPVGIPCDDEDGCEESNDYDDNIRIPTGIAVGFELAALTWAILDLATIPLAVQRANEKALEKKESEQKISGVVIAPLFAPGPNGATTAGFAFSMRF